MSMENTDKVLRDILVDLEISAVSLEAAKIKLHTITSPIVSDAIKASKKLNLALRRVESKIKKNGK